MELAKIHRRRIRILIALIIMAGAVTVGRLFSLQVVQGEGFKEQAERQYLSPVNASFDRGTIYMTKKDGTSIAGATVATGFKLAINPQELVSPQQAYQSLSTVLFIDEVLFFERAARTNDPYEEVAERLTKQQADAVITLGIPGVNVYRQKWRLYPGGELAAKVLGFVSYKGDELLGRYGLERQYNDVLARSEGSFYVNFFAEIFANVQTSLFKNKGPTGDIVTTIEPVVQAQLETTIKKIQERWGSDAVGGVVMDPFTGEIVAMAHVPTFDLNAFSKVEDISVYTNPFVQDVYEMGSIIKPVVVAGALDAGVITPATSYQDKGFVEVQDRTFYNFDRKGRGMVDIQDVLNQSLNTGMVFIQQKMGKELFRSYLLEKYKLGEKTGVDLPGEVNGLVSGLKSNNDVNFASSSFGQGIATSPINIVRSYATLANGGTLVTPHVVKAIEQQSGFKKVLEYQTIPDVITPETSRTISTMLTEVVDEGYKQGLEHYSVAAKTGTAQMARPDGKGYYDDRNFHSFIGYFPASSPRYVLYLFNNFPKGASFSSQTLADPFFEMVQFLTSYYEITPDR